MMLERVRMPLRCKRLRIWRWTHLNSLGRAETGLMYRFRFLGYGFVRRKESNISRKLMYIFPILGPGRGEIVSFEIRIGVLRG